MTGDHKETTSGAIQTETPSEMSRPQTAPLQGYKNVRRSWWAWLAILLLPLVFFLPILGERIQISLIGDEGFCCMPENWQELMWKAERAKSMRLDSNLVIGTGIILAILLMGVMVYILYKYAVPCIQVGQLRRIAQVAVGILVAPIGFLLLLTLMVFVLHNDEYYSTRYQPSEDDFYIYPYTLDFVRPSLDWEDDF